MTDNSLNKTDISVITGYHAHIYYDESSKPRAALLREAVQARFAVEMGRWRDEPVGPHPSASYQVAFAPGLFAQIIPWLSLNRDGLTIFIHAETGDSLADHRDHAIWMGRQQDLKLSMFR
jgi:DOPA 4,5-dioxygenase